MGVPVLFGEHNLPTLVEIGLTDLPKFGAAMAPSAPPGTTGLHTYLLLLSLLYRPLHMYDFFSIKSMAKSWLIFQY